MAPAPLAGLRVLEVGNWSVAFAGRLLADGGADVVRIVAPAGDPLDAEPPFYGQSGVSIQSTWYNAGKRILPLDLSPGAGRGRLLELIAAADVLLEDWPPGRPPLSGAEIEAARPGLVRVSVTPFGLSGPWSGYRTNDLVANALSGAASVTGNAETPPINGYGNQTHHTAGLYAAICALASLQAARATGTSQHVDLSAHEALVSCTEQIPMQLAFPAFPPWNARVAQRQGSLHWSGAYEVYPGRTGREIMVTVALRLVEEIIPWMQSEGAAQDLADPGRYPDVVALIRDLPHVMEVVRDWVARSDADELFFEAQRRHLPFGVVWNVATALRSPQIPARGYLQTVEAPGFGPAPMPGPLFRTSADAGHQAPPARVASPPRWDERPPARPRGGPASAAAPLAGVRILDFTHVLAGPFGTRVLGDLGAEVIKVSTASRSGGANGPQHPYYMCWNRSKRSVLVNMAMPEGRDLCRRLAEKCDAVIENFSAGVLARWDIDRESLKAVNPGVTVVSMGGMGQSGPWKDFVTFAPTIHALTGLTYLTNPPGRHDLGYGFSLTDHLSGLAGALAILEGLEHRRRTGEGLSIDLAQYELGLGIMAPALIDHMVNGANAEPVGNRHPFGAWAPHGIYRCKGEDRWVAVAVRGDAEWARLCQLMGREGLAADPRFATHVARLEHADALDAEIDGWTAALDRYEVMRLCQGAGLASGAVQDGGDLADNDPQLAHSRFFITIPSSTAWGDYLIDRFPARFNGRQIEAYEGVHDLGADAFEVLAGVLGLGDGEVADLIEGGVLS